VSSSPGVSFPSMFAVQRVHVPTGVATLGLPGV
jgi:hypothetical protein